MNKYWKSDFCYTIAKAFGKYPTAKKYNFYSPKYKIEPPFIVLSNHTTDNDAIFIASSFSVPIHFVMSDHICAKPFGKIISKMLGAIPITKSKKDISAIKQIIEIKNNGGAIGLFPEGNKSYSGKMCYIKPSIAKLVKMLGIPVVLYTIDGGYFSSPRWATTKRRGKIEGKIQKIISPEELREKTTEEIYQIIKDGICIDAYERQSKNKIAYNGKSLCKNIESLIYYCPKCHNFDTLHGYQNQIRCDKCDLLVELDEYGYFYFSPFGTLTDWDEAQQKEINKIDFDGDDVIFIDEDCSLKRIVDHYHNPLVGKYLMSLQHKKLIFVPRSPKYEFFAINISDIDDYALEGINGLQLCMKNGDIYRINNKKSTNAIKYIDAICAINNYKMR